MNSENKVIENKGASTIFYLIVGVIYLCALYTIHVTSLQYSIGFGLSYISTLLILIKTLGGPSMHALLPFFLILLIVIFKIVIEKTSSIGRFAAKLGSFVSKKILTLVSNVLLFMVAGISAGLVYGKYSIITGYQILGGNFVVDCIMIASLFVLIFIKKFN